MKLLKLVSDLQAAKDIEATLKSVGILTFIANEEPPHSNQNRPRPSINIVRIGVWVVLDYQYEDALHAMNNPKYVVKQPLIPQDINAMAKVLHKPYTRAVRQLLYFIATLFTGIVAFCILSYYLRS